VAAPNCIQLALIYLLSGETAETTWHYRLSAPATNANLATAVTTLFAWFTSNQSNFTNGITIQKGYARALDTINSPTYEANPASPLSGTGAGAIAPNNVTFAVTRYTGKAGRKMRGRVYFPGIFDAWIGATNQLNASSAATLVTLYDSLRTAMLGATPAFTEIILHRADGTHDDVIGYRYSDQWLDSMRRRLPGHNRHH
jgi:hypothetical protein